MRRVHKIGIASLFALAGIAACTLNPQPFPPEPNAATGGPGDSFGEDSDGRAPPPAQDSGTSTGGNAADSDAASDAGADAGADVDAGGEDASDASDASDEDDAG